MIEDTIDDLNKLLEFELGALDTYKQNLTSTTEKSFSKVLEENRNSHSERVKSLQDAIKKLNGKEVAAAKVWGTFGKAIGSATAALNDQATINVLANGENSLLDEYKAMIEKRGNSAILGRLLASQEESRRLINELKKSA
jgi:Domain of unknown function (DUF2383)